MKEYIELKRRIVYRGDAYQAINDELIKVSAYAICSEYMRGVEDGMKRTLGVLAHRVKDIPAADVVEVRKAKWVATDKYMVDKCSNCQFEMDWDDVPLWLVDMPHFSDCCPNCGAKMDGGTDDA